MAVVADELLLVVKTNVAQAMAGLEAVETKATGMGGKLKGAAALGGKAVLGIGVAAGAVAVGAGKMAMGFETSLATLQANAGFTAEEIDKIKGPIKDVSSEFGMATDAVADIAFMLKSAGMSADEAGANMGSVAKAVKSNLGEAADLAQLGAVAFANFGLDVSETMDVLNTAAGNAIVGPAEMGKAFQQLMGPSGAAGQSLQEMAKNTTVLTNAFGSAEFGATKYKAMLTKVLVPTKEAEGALADIGLSMDNFKNGMAESVSETLGVMKRRFNDIGVSDDEWIAKFFPDAEAFTGAAAILASESMTAISNAIDDSSGSLDKSWDTMAETGAVKMAQLKQSAMNLLLPLGEMIMTHVIPALTALIDWLGGLGDKAEGVGQFVKTAFETIKSIFTGLGDSAGGLSNIFQAFWDTLKEVWQGIVDFVGPLVEDMIGFIMGEVGELKEWWDAVWPALRETIEVVLGVIQRAWERFWPIIQERVEIVWNAIKAIISGALDIIKGLIQVVVNVITGNWGEAWEGVKRIVSGAVEIVVGVVTFLWEMVQSLFDQGIAMIATIWDGFWSLLGNAVTAAWEGVKNIVKGGVNSVLGWIEGLVNGAIGALNRLIDMANKVPGVNISKVSTISIPRLAQGGNVTAPGMAMVGERGPEILSLPKGARVTPLTEPGLGSFGGDTTIVVQVGDEEFAKFVLDKTGLSGARQARRMR